jgi:hypothetical protein
MKKNNKLIYERNYLKTEKGHGKLKISLYVNNIVTSKTIPSKNSI